MEEKAARSGAAGEKYHWREGDFPFDYIAQNIFYPIYGVIAEDIIQRTGCRSGNILDIGCGGGHLGLALLERTGCRGCFVDINETALRMARSRAAERGLLERCEFFQRDARLLGLPDNFANLIVSRGSWHFWDDLEGTLLEIYRVLAPGGYTYIGGGLGNARLAAEIREKMRELWPEWPEVVQKRQGGIASEELRQLLGRHGVRHEILENQEQGCWIIMTKERSDG